jgi:hypothetical protein
MPTNDFGQAIGSALPDWTVRPHPPRTSITGRFCRVEPLDAARHADDLFASLGSLRDGRWTYLPYGPFDTREQFQRWISIPNGLNERAHSRLGLHQTISTSAVSSVSRCRHSCPRRLCGYDLKMEDQRG